MIKNINYYIADYETILESYKNEKNKWLKMSCFSSKFILDSIELKVDIVNRPF